MLLEPDRQVGGLVRVWSVWPIRIAAWTVVPNATLWPAMRSGAFTHDPNTHTVVVSGDITSGVEWGIRIWSSVFNIRPYPELVLVANLYQKDERNRERKLSPLCLVQLLVGGSRFLSAVVVFHAYPQNKPYNLRSCLNNSHICFLFVADRYA